MPKTYFFPFLEKDPTLDLLQVSKKQKIRPGTR